MPLRIQKNCLTFIARSIDKDIKHQGTIYKQAYEHKGSSYVEVYQYCNIFNDGAFSVLTDRDTKLDNVIYLNHEEPMAFGHRDAPKGLILDGFKLKVVSLDEGTANFANIEGYEVAGKTGTSIKYNSNEKLNTFVSIFPASKPEYVLLVMLDEPKPAPNFVYNFFPTDKYPNGYKHKGETRNTSGWNTVVVVGKIIEKIGPILAIKSLQASTNF